MPGLLRYQTQANKCKVFLKVNPLSVRIAVMSRLTPVPRLLLIIVPALWIVAIAILSVQNATLVSIQFLTLRSVALPFGVILSFGVAGGMLVAAALLMLLNTRQNRR